MSDHVPGLSVRDEMKLSKLFHGIIPLNSFSGDLEVEGVSSDSRQVCPGDIFVAIPGHEKDGRAYVTEAVYKGASAVVLSKPVSGVTVPQFAVENPRLALPQLAARFYEEPSKHLRLFGITGTNGKTTLTFLLESIFNVAGFVPGVLGTVNYRYPGKTLEAPNTTPGPLALQRLLAEMKRSNVSHVVMEVSSHALDQERVREIHFDGVAFTNLTWDHLDYHATLEDYFAAKLRLFTEVLPASKKRDKFCVINREDSWGRKIVGECGERLIEVGFEPSCTVYGKSFEMGPSGSRLKFVLEGKEGLLNSSLMGRFNLENILVAIGMAHGAGISMDQMIQGIEAVRVVPGRLESIPNNRGFFIFVDYAHTPDALARVGQTVKGVVPGRLITVFGCGGDRDPHKRPMMGREVTQFSDLVIVTSDNPRTEEPEKIINEIWKGIRETNFPHGKLLRIPDRREALRKSLELARPGDGILIAGKGHEDYQIIGKEKFHFSDQEVLKEILGGSVKGESGR